MSHSPSSPSLRALLKRHGLFTNRGLGQHFLADDEVLEAIARAAEPNENSQVVEVGAGPANLTTMLSLSGARITSLELDHRYSSLHREIALTRPEWEGRVKFVYVDALDFDFAAASREAREQGLDFRLVGNIPYQITTPLIMKVLETGVVFSTMVLMMQKEVAQRLLAPAGSSETGSVALKVQHYCVVEEVMQVPPRSFMPPPKVDSTVVRFLPKEPSDARLDSSGRPRYFAIIDMAFRHRRKTLPNALLSAGPAPVRGTERPAQLNREKIEMALEKLSISPKARPQELTGEQYQVLDTLLHDD